jgi:hypothetical protein
LPDETDSAGATAAAMPVRKKPTVWSYAKEGVAHLAHNRRRVSPAKEEQVCLLSTDEVKF